MKIFIPIVGQYTNVGDVMHRKQLVSWLKPIGELHVYVGNAPKSFIEGINLENAILYRNLFQWLLAIFASLGKKSAFVFTSGEINLRRKRLLGEIMLLPFIILLRLRGGKVFRIGIAARINKSRIKIIWKLIFKLSTKIYWRTKSSQQFFNIGRIVPDLAFNETISKKHSESRRYLTLSMRYDRPEPTYEILEGIKEFAIEHDLEVIVLSQVRNDNKRTQHIASQMGVKAIIWHDNASHSEQEKIVRDIYSNTSILVSDRLHVLIAGSTELAVPVAILTKDNSKVKDHYEIIGYQNLTKLGCQCNKEQLKEFLLIQLSRKNELKDKLSYAKSILDSTRDEIVSLLMK